MAAVTTPSTTPSSPSDGERTGTAPAPPATVNGIPARVTALRSVFDSGRTRPVAWRKEQLRAVKRLVTDEEDALVEALRSDLGKPPAEGYVTEIGFMKAEADYALRHLDRWMRPEKVAVPLPQMPAKARIHRDPLGVVLIIGPWNYPIQLILAPLVAALAGGNTAVVKPSEVAPATSAALARLVPRYLDPEAVAVVEGAVPETTALLAERFDHIFYTGNGTIGRVVMEAAAKHLTPVTLELGGKSPVIVDHTADLDVAARRIAWGKYLNAGQTCVAPDYVLAERSVRDPLLEKVEAAKRSFYGDDPHRSLDYARIVNERHFGRLEGLLDSTGAAVAFGGERDAGDLYFSPTAILDPAPDDRIMQEEIFGPILPFLAVEDVAEAIDFVNGRDNPLALYVFTGDDRVADAVAGATSSGGMCVNATLYHLAVPGLPFGGVGESGIGAYHGRAGFETFTHRKSVLRKPTRPDPPVAYPPYTRLKAALLRRFL